MKKTFLITCIAFLAVVLAFGSSLSLAQEKDKGKEGTVPAESKEAEEQPGSEVEEKDKKPEGAEATAKEAEDKEKAALEEEVKKLKSEVETLKQEGEKTIQLLDGKIKYTVDPTAVMDYEEIVALTEKGDPAFKESMQKGGKEADMALLEILKKISPDDRRITSAETKAYQKSMMQASAKPEAAPAPETKKTEQPAAEGKEAAPAPETKEPEQPAAEEK
jgi:hypothetical protein